MKINYGINFIYKKREKTIINSIKFQIPKYIAYSFNNSKNDYLDILVNDNYECSGKKYKNIAEIIKENNVVPQLYVNNLNIEKYKNDLVKIEHKKDKEKSRLFKQYDKLFIKNFNVIDGLNDVYEWYTGSVFFKNYEWEEIKNNKLKDLFEVKINDSYIYSLPVDDGILLRGDNIYYYFSTDVSRFEKPSKSQISKWFKNINDFINRVNNILDCFEIKNNYDKRLLLALLDNFRNIILLLTNCELMFLSHEGQDFIIQNNSDKTINEYYNLIEEYQNMIEVICFNNNVIDINVLKNMINKLSKLQITTHNKINKINDEFVLAKCFNPLREIDNYFENYIVCKKIVDNLKFNNDEINLIGILYGGLELPFIIKRLSNIKTNIIFMFQNHGMYLDRQKKDKNTVLEKILEYGNLNKKLKTFIVDDNIMSGITMQFAYNQLNSIGFNNIENILVIRHPNINRLAQLEYFDTALNLKLIDKFIKGMITDTPYTKIKRNTNYNNMFVNELNIFSIMTEVFLKALYCNNSFIKDSQVDIFEGYSGGKNDKI